MRVVLLLVLCACSTTIRVSRDDLQAEVASHFPREIDKRIAVIRLSDPEVSLPGSRFDLRVRVDATTFTGRSTVAGTARVDGTLEYVAAEHAFYLRQPRVTELQLDSATGPGQAARFIKRVDVTSVVRVGIVEVLLRHPIYRLQDPRAARHLRSAHIENGELLLRVGW